MKTNRPTVQAHLYVGAVMALLCLPASGETDTLAKSSRTKKPEAPEQPNAIFFPMPPDPPRVQFLKGFSTSADLQERPTGAFTKLLTGKPPEPQVIMKPYGLAIHGGKMEITDTVINTIHVVDIAKGRMRAFAPKGEAIIRVPINISIDEDGTRYIADTGRKQVVIFGANEKYLGAIGERDEMKPTDVAIGSKRIYVTDLKEHNVRVYDKEARKLLFTIPRGEVTPTNQLYSPTNLALDADGNVYVSDIGAFRVLKFDPEGKYLMRFAQHGDAPGALARPKGIAVDRQGRLYVVDAATQVLQMWDALGRLLLHFGEPGVSPVSLNIPSKVVVDYEHVALFEKYAAPGFKIEHLIIVVSQYGDRKVSVFGFGSKKP